MLCETQRLLLPHFRRGPEGPSRSQGGVGAIQEAAQPAFSKIYFITKYKYAGNVHLPAVRVLQRDPRPAGVLHGLVPVEVVPSSKQRKTTLVFPQNNFKKYFLTHPAPLLCFMSPTATAVEPRTSDTWEKSASDSLDKKKNESRQFPSNRIVGKADHSRTISIEIWRETSFFRNSYVPTD